MGTVTSAHYVDSTLYVEPVTIDPAVEAAARRTLARHDALDLEPMLLGELGPVRHRDTTVSERSARRRARKRGSGRRVS